jgi:hypothetical protein
MYQTLEDRLVLLKHTANEQTSIPIRKILEILSGKGRLLILILLTLPFCLPLPLPGMSVPFGLLIAFFGVRMTLGKGIWLPKRIVSKKIKTHLLKKIVTKTLWLMKKMQVLTHPRLYWMCFNPVMKVVNGIVIAILGLALAIPFPIPFSNITAAWAIFILCFGLMEDDGLFILIGYLLLLVTLVIYTIIGTSISAIV